MKYNLVNFCEFDKYAVKSYCAIHGADESLNLGDITKVDKLPKCDFLTYGFPCQDISTAGLQAGIKQGTRSGLLFEVERLLEQAEYKPKFLLMENVKNLTGKGHRASFDLWLAKLEELGYVNYYEVLNSKHYGIPHNRERVFCLSVRKDIDNGFEFPPKQELKIPLKGLLEKEVDEKFYISTDKVEKLVKQIIEKQGESGLGEMLKAQPIIIGGEQKNQAIKAEIQQVGQIYGTQVEPNPQAGRIFSADGISPTMDSCNGGNRMPKIIEVEKIGHYPYPNSDKAHQSNAVYSANGIAPTIDTVGGLSRGPSVMEVVCIDKSINNTGVIENANCITAREDRGISNRKSEGTAIMEVQTLGNVNPSGKGQNGTVISETGLARTVTVEKGEGQKILSVHPILTPDRLEKRQNGRRCKEDGEPMFTLTGQDRHGVLITMTDGDAFMVYIRKLTPLECWRLQGFDDESFYRAKYESKEFSEDIFKRHPNHKGKRIMKHGERIERMSNSQLYKQAGNSITVDVLVAIYEKMREFYPNDFTDGIDVVTLFSGIGAFEKAFEII